MRNLIKTLTPEEAELAAKKAELESFSQLLAEKELYLEELKLTVSGFQHRYYSHVGKRYVELAEVQAQIAELKASQMPQDQELQQEAVRAREQARKAAEEYEGLDTAPEEPLEPEESEEAKMLYRKIALTIHPDKATDDKSRQVRTRLMSELNEAYARQDIAKMRNIVEQWHESPDVVSGEGTAADLVRTIREMAQIKRRISGIDAEIDEIRARVKSLVNYLA